MHPGTDGNDYAARKRAGTGTATETNRAPAGGSRQGVRGPEPEQYRRRTVVEDAALIGALVLAPLLGLFPVVLFRLTDGDSRRDPPEPGECTHCGETNEPGYSRCRNCGSRLDNGWSRSAFLDR